VNGNQFTYTSGSATGTDIVRLTAPGGACGVGTATFTATVIEPGDPVIDFFSADPARGCGLSSNIVLTWQTENTRSVSINPVSTPFGLAPNGSVGTTISSDTTFTLTAFPILVEGPTATQTLTVPVDPQAYTPILNPSSVSVPASSATIFVTVTGVPDPTNLRTLYIQNQSGSFFQATSTPGVYAYDPGFRPGVDIVRIFYSNGCGFMFAPFTATVN
jgi:hypothetical protein